MESATSPNSAAANPGSVSVSGLRPPPGRRTRPSEATGPDSNSAAPSATVCHDTPAAFETAVIPPSPAARATAPNTSRLARSSNPGSSNPNCGPINSTSSAFTPIHDPDTRHTENSPYFGMLTYGPHVPTLAITVHQQARSQPAAGP